MNIFLDEIISSVQKISPKKTIAVAQAADVIVLQSIMRAYELNLANFLLVGDKKELLKLAQANNCDWIEDEQIIQVDSEVEAAQLAVQAVVKGQAQAIMKGDLQTGVFLRAILDKENGLRGPGLLSQCGVYENPNSGRLLFITDCAMNRTPDLLEKKAIIENSVALAHCLGIARPKVAILAALELINPEMPETVDAAILSKMCQRNQITGCVIDGPFAMDNAVSKEAAKYKNLHGEVAGDADIILVPDLKTGNAIHKTITFFTQIKNAALCLGAASPVIMTSRTDSIETKVYSIVLGCLGTKIGTN